MLFALNVFKYLIYFFDFFKKCTLNVFLVDSIHVLLVFFSWVHVLLISKYFRMYFWIKKNPPTTVPNTSLVGELSSHNNFSANICRPPLTVGMDYIVHVGAHHICPDQIDCVLYIKLAVIYFM